MTNTSNGQQLVRQAVEGDRNALEQLMLDNYASLASRVATRLPASLRARISVDDVVQQTYMRVFQTIARFEPRGEASFFSWLCTIANNRIQDELRAHHRKKNEGGFDRLAADLVVEVEDDKHTASQSIARREAVSAIRIAMAGLPEHYRQAVQLRFFEGYTVEQIADEMQRSPGAVRGLLDRAKRELRDGLGRASLYLSSR